MGATVVQYSAQPNRGLDKSGHRIDVGVRKILPYISDAWPYDAGMRNRNKHERRWIVYTYPQASQSIWFIPRGCWNRCASDVRACS